MRRLKTTSLLLALLLGVQMLCAQDGYILHTVLKGQGLYSIARIYGVSEADIIALNPGSDVVIRAGEQLKIPAKKGDPRAVFPTEEKAPQTPVVKPVLKEEAAPDGFIRHTVQAGETIYRLTITYGVTGEEIYRANPALRTEPLKAGQVVLIPDKKRAEVQTDVQTNGNADDRTVPTAADQNEPTAKKSGYRIKGAYGSRAEKSDGDNLWSRLFGKKKTTTPSGTDTPSPAPQPTISGDSMCEYQHVVKKGETVYSITHAYGITEAMLLAANPTIANNKIKRGQVLCIPYKIDLDSASDDGVDLTDDIVPIDDTFENAPDVHSDGMIRVALILPFMLGETTSTPTADQAKMVEFYEGFLLAIDSLRSDGVSIELHVFDSGEATRSIRPILDSDEMANIDIIFGPMHTKHVNEAADFARSHSIPLVLPFSRNLGDLIRHNRFIWQVNADQSTIEDEGISHFFELFPKPNVLFFQTKDVTNAFCTHLQRELDDRGLPYTVFPADTTSNVRRFIDACSRNDEADNILMMTSSDNASLSTMIPVFQLIMRDTASVADTHLYGYPQYQTYATAHASEFYELDTWYHTAFYTDSSRPDAVSLGRLFRHMYGRDMGARYPRFGLLGFDIGHWFLGGMAHRGPAPVETVFAGMTTYRSSTIQTGFNFTRVSPEGGYVNSSVFVVHMRADGQTFKVDFAW